MKDGCRLLIKISVFIEHFNVKEILVHGLYNSWRTFSLLYRSSTVHCAMMQLMKAVGCPTPTNTRLLNPPIEHDVVYPVSPFTKQVAILPTEPEPTIWGVFLLSLSLALLLSVLFFLVRRHSPILQSCAELCVEHQTVADWSQFCHKAMSNFILICSLQLILMAVGGWVGGVWQSCGNRW